MATEDAKKPAGGAQPPVEQTEKKLSNAELKAKAKAEKAARRAAAKQNEAKAGGKPAGKQDAGQASAQKADKGHVRQGETKPAEKPKAEKEPDTPEIFSHLPIAKRISTAEAGKDVHPAVLEVGQLMGAFTLRDSIARVEAMLLAFKKVLESYETPPGNTISRHFTPHVLNPQIEYLVDCRPLCFSMGNAIRWLKLQVSKVDIETSDEEAKKQLCQAIDKFILQRVTISNRIIAMYAAEEIEDDDTILTHTGNFLIEDVFLRALERGTKFRVIVVDDAFEPHGAAMAGRLHKKGVDVIYSPDIRSIMVLAKRCTKAMIAAEAVFENGSIYARAGACETAISADMAKRDFIVLCQGINFTDRIAIDGLTYNEIDPDRATSDGLRILFDVVPPQDVSEIITEEGGLKTHMIPTILKKFDFL